MSKEVLTIFEKKINNRQQQLLTGFSGLGLGGVPFDFLHCLIINQCLPLFEPFKRFIFTLHNKHSRLSCQSHQQRLRNTQHRKRKEFSLAPQRLKWIYSRIPFVVCFPRLNYMLVFFLGTHCSQKSKLGSLMFPKTPYLHNI